MFKSTCLSFLSVMLSSSEILSGLTEGGLAQDIKNNKHTEMDKWNVFTAISPLSLFSFFCTVSLLAMFLYISQLSLINYITRMHSHARTHSQAAVAHSFFSISPCSLSHNFLAESFSKDKSSWASSVGRERRERFACRRNRAKFNPRKFTTSASPNM